jgi:hypothetical protein
MPTLHQRQSKLPDPQLPDALVVVGVQKVLEHGCAPFSHQPIPVTGTAVAEDVSVDFSSVPLQPGSNHHQKPFADGNSTMKSTPQQKPWPSLLA